MLILLIAPEGIEIRTVGTWYNLPSAKLLIAPEGIEIYFSYKYAGHSSGSS